MANTGVRSGVALAAAGAVVFLSGCTSGPVASVGALETAVMLAAGTEGDPREVTESVDAREGDVVSTDSAGVAEVVFPDESFMRLGPDSAVTITELGSAEVQRTSIELDIGETWHNVVELVAEDAVYEVVTPVGVASVRGTTFAVICTEGPSCEFIVFDGEIEVEGITLTPYQRVVLPEQPEPVTIPVDVLPEWATANIERDGEREGAEPLPDPPLEAASITGEWATSGAVVSSSDPDIVAGETSAGEWIVGDPVCDDDGCRYPVESLTSGWTNDITRTADGALGFEFPPQLVDCLDLETGEVSTVDGATIGAVWALTITGAEMVDGEWVATTFDARSEQTTKLEPPAIGSCNVGEPDPQVVVREFAVVRSA